MEIGANAQTSRLLQSEGIPEVEKTGYHKQQHLRIQVQRITKFSAKKTNRDCTIDMPYKYRIWLLRGRKSCPCRNKTAQDTMHSLQRFLPRERKPGVIYTDKSLAFTKACVDLLWNHDKSTPHRSDTNGIAERAVRVKEGTSTLLVQSGLDLKRLGEATESYGHFTQHSRFIGRWEDSW